MSRGGISHPSVARLYADARDSYRLSFRQWYALVAGRWPVKPLKGMSAEPTSLSRRSLVTEHGMAYGARALRSRSANSSRGSDASPGSAGKPRTGRSGAGGRMSGICEGRVMRNAVAGPAIDRHGSVKATGERLKIERLTSRSERGRWKRAKWYLAGGLPYIMLRSGAAVGGAIRLSTVTVPDPSSSATRTPAGSTPRLKCGRR